MTFSTLRRLFRPGRRLPMLDDWSAMHTDPASGVWAVSPPCGHGLWLLWPPGAADPDADFPYEGDPAAEHPARPGENGGDRLADIEHWLRPWVERESGGRITELVEGWCAPYGPDRNLREYAIYARVTVSQRSFPASYRSATGELQP